MIGIAGVPYWRLSGFYFFYFATVGSLLPYWSLYLKSLDFSNAEIGELVAILVATKIVAPNVWGWIADHRGKRMKIVRLASLLSCITFAGIFLSQSYLAIALVMIGFGFFWNASLPQFEATTMNYLGGGTDAYTRIRVWGSVGFIVAVVVLGMVFDHYGVSSLPLILIFMMVGIWLVSETVPEEAAGHLHIEHTPIADVLKRAPVVALLLCCFLIQMGHGPYYTFFSIFLEDHGYNRSLIGQLWALGVVAEVAVFIVMHRMIPAVGLKNLLLLSLIRAVVRWLMIGWGVDSLMVLLLAQCLHAATFGIYHAVAIQLIHRYFTGKNQGRGQALYSSLSFGAGGAAGTLLSGYAWDGIGAEYTFTAAALVCVVASFIAWRWLE